jgi:hypothetical protein
VHVLRGKFLEPVKVQQDPLCVFPKAHFPHRWRGARTLKKRGFAGANLLVEPGNQTPCLEAVNVVRIAKLGVQQVLSCIDRDKDLNYGRQSR